MNAMSTKERTAWLAFRIAANKARNSLDPKLSHQSNTLCSEWRKIAREERK